MAMLVLLFLAAFLAFTVSTLSGGGAGLVLLPILGLVVPAAQVPAALSIGTAVSALSRVRVFRRAIRWQVVAWFVPAALPFAALGAWLLTFVQPLWLELALGLFLAVNAVVMLRAPEAPDGEGAGVGRVAWLALGAVGGFLSGFSGAIGLVLNRFYLRSGLDPREIVATRAANEVLLHLAKLALYAGFGLMTREALVAGGLAAASAALATVSARRVLDRLDARSFRHLAHAATCLAGLAMLGSASAALAERHGLALGGHVGLSRIEAKLAWREGAASLSWHAGRPPELERTITLAALPADLRARVADVGMGAERIVCERVLRPGASGYEVTIYRDGRRLRLEA